MSLTCPAKHDVLNDDGKHPCALREGGMQGSGLVRFEKKGVHFIGTGVNRDEFESGGLGTLGQINWNGSKDDR